MFEHIGWREIAMTLGGCWLGVASFIGKRALAELDSKASKDDLAKALQLLDRHLEDDKEHRSELAGRLDTMSETLTDVQVDVARIAGRLER